jgi:hypothetical protein
MDLMVDIETLGTGIRAVITQIGACYFDRNTGEIGKTFCENIRIQDSLNKGFEVDGDAIKFWLQQDKTIIKNMLKDAQDIEKVLGHFKQFYKKGTIAWAHTTFDFPILSNAYYRLGLGQAIPYKMMRDIRTLVDLSKTAHKKKEGDPKTHNALDDCIYQVKYCVECFKKFKEK